MDEKLERDLIIKSILALASSIYTDSGGIPDCLNDESLNKMGNAELRSLYARFRDMSRSLGGSHT